MLKKRVGGRRRLSWLGLVLGGLAFRSESRRMPALQLQIRSLKRGGEGPSRRAQQKGKMTLQGTSRPGNGPTVAGEGAPGEKGGKIQKAKPVRHAVPACMRPWRGNTGDGRTDFER